jgi:hypothetical protein
VHVSTACRMACLDRNRRLSEFRYQCDNNMLMTCTRCIEFSYRICGFQGSDMSSNHTSVTRERVCVSTACRMACLDRNRRLSEFRYQYGEFENHIIFEYSDRFTTSIQA